MTARFELPPLPAPPRRVLKMRADRALCALIRGGHPWIYRKPDVAPARDHTPGPGTAPASAHSHASALASGEAPAPGASGSLVSIYDPRNRFLAIGLHEPVGMIAVRILQVGEPTPIDAAWFAARLAAAAARREGLAGADTTGFRVVHGENDGLPGVVLDRYDATLVLKLYTASWVPHLGALLEAIDVSLPFERLVLRLPRTVGARAGRLHGLADGQVLAGGPPPAGGVTFLESGLTFVADVCTGQKTGFFLDQRENRRRVRRLAAGRETLNSFSHTGAFSVYAAAGGAASVCDLDISARALEAARRHFALNPALGRVAHACVKGDAFAMLPALVRQRRSFDLVIVDPPSFAMREADRPRAIAAYASINAVAVALLRPGGILVTCSCSAHVTPEEFRGALTRALGRRRHRVIEETGHALDHPVGFPEGRYLKALFIET